MSFLSKHYEKLILMVLLFLFLTLFGFQLVKTLMDSTSISPEEETLTQRIPDNYQPIDLKDPKYDVEKAMQAGMKDSWKKRMQGGMDLLVPYPMIRCTIGRHLIPAVDIQKKKPVCSYCGEDLTSAAQAPSAASPAASRKVASVRDSDSDGMPDNWEIRYQLDPKNPADAAQDKDGDGFTNLEECRFRTDPTIPTSRPSYASKLFLMDVKQEQVGVRLKHFGLASRSNPVAKWSIQLEVKNPRNPSRKKSIMKKLGENFDTVSVAGKTERYLLKSIREKWSVDSKSKASNNESVLEIVRLSDNTSIFVSLGKEAIDPKQTVRLYFDVPFVREKEISCTLGSSIVVGSSRVGKDTFLVQSVNMEERTAQLKDKRTGRITVVKPYDQGVRNREEAGGGEMEGRREPREMRTPMPPDRRRRGGAPQF